MDSYTFPSDGYILAISNYRAGSYVSFKLGGANGVFTRSVSIGALNTGSSPTAMTNNSIVVNVKKGMSVTGITCGTQYDLLYFYPIES